MTDQEKSCGIHLQQLFESKGIQVIPKENIMAYNPDSVSYVLQEITQEEGSDDISINLTGGTKIMSFAAYDFAKKHELPAFYCNTEDKQLIHLLPKNRIDPFAIQLTIKDYLLAYGYKILEHKDHSEIQKYFPLFEFIEKNKLIMSFLYFNEQVRTRLAQSNPKFSVISQDKNFSFQKNFGSFRIEFGSSKQNTFTVDESDFKSGDWLEYYVYYKLKNEQNVEIISGVKISSDKNVINEIDLIALKDYKLYLISCKSGKKDDQYDLFQLETIRSISSGTFGKGLFVTTKKNSDLFIKRAEELNLKVINISDGESIKL